MNTETKTRSFCRQCGQPTWHDVRASVSGREIEVNEEPPAPALWADVLYELLQCCGCDCVTMRSTLTCKQVYGDQNEVRHFPPSTARRRPPWERHLPGPTQFLLREIYNSLHSGSLRLAVMGARTLVDMAMLDKVGDCGTFVQKLEALQDQGFISKRNREVLAAALGAGHASAHLGHKFQPHEVNQLMDIVENLLQAIYVLEKAAQKIKTATPVRPRLAQATPASPTSAPELPAKAQTPSKKPASAWDGLEDRVLEHLRKPTTKPPGTGKKLVTYLATHLGHAIPESEVAALIKHISQAGHLVIDDKDKVTYHLKPATSSAAI